MFEKSGNNWFCFEMQKEHKLKKIEKKSYANFGSGR